jgi:uncharacterized integral membrane protein
MALLHRNRPDTGTADTVAGPGTAARPAAGGTPEQVVVRKTSVSAILKTVVATLLLVAIVLVAAANTDEVPVDLLFETYDVALSLLVGATAVAGFLIGLLIGTVRQRRRRTAASA